MSNSSSFDIIHLIDSKINLMISHKKMERQNNLSIEILE